MAGLPPFDPTQQTSITVHPELKRKAEEALMEDPAPDAPLVDSSHQEKESMALTPELSWKYATT